MKRLAVIFLTGALILSLGMPQALATQDEVTEAGTEIISSDFPEEELDKVLTQDSPWYFLKRFFERVRIIFTFRQESKAEVWADLAEERAKEYATLERKYAGEDIDEEQLKLLDKALQEVLKFTEEYMEHIRRMKKVKRCQRKAKRGRRHYCGASPTCRELPKELLNPLKEVCPGQSPMPAANGQE